jgi:uncharacterized membrane protein (UPF0136 family)
MNIPVWKYVLSMGVYFTLLMAIVGCMRKYYKFSNWFWLASLLTFPIWLMSGGVVGWFRWFKIVSVIIPTIFLGFSRVACYEKRQGKFWGALQKDWVLGVLFGVLFLNIMEATVKDLQTGNYFNSLCGFLLCVTMPYAPKFWKLSTDNGDRGDLIAYTTIAWNFLYTTWNLCFVYGESHNFFASSVCILLAAEIYPLIKRRPELYITSRVYTLATHMLFRACVPNLFPAVMDSSAWFNPDVLKYWGMLNAILIIPYVFWHTWQLHTGKSEVTFRRGKVNYLSS